MRWGLLRQPKDSVKDLPLVGVHADLRTSAERMMRNDPPEGCLKRSAGLDVARRTLRREPLDIILLVVLPVHLHDQQTARVGRRTMNGFFSTLRGRP